MTKWYSTKEAPDLYEWIVAEWYDSDEKEYKYETDFGTPSANWDEYVKRNNITFNIFLCHTLTFYDDKHEVLLPLFGLLSSLNKF